MPCGVEIEFWTGCRRLRVMSGSARGNGLPEKLLALAKGLAAAGLAASCAATVATSFLISASSRALPLTSAPSALAGLPNLRTAKTCETSKSPFGPAQSQQKSGRATATPKTPPDIFVS